MDVPKNPEPLGPVAGDGSDASPAPAPALLDLLDHLDLRPHDVQELLVTTRSLVVDDVAEAVETGIPVVQADELASMSARDADAIRRRGCVVVRGTFERAEAESWDAEVGDYLTTNQFERRWAERYPEAARNGTRIWGVYWSKPQIEARQHQRMQLVRSGLNALWSNGPDGTEFFRPDHDIAYPDRLRRRAPGVAAPGLRPHSDAPSTGGWRVPENIGVLRHVFEGRPELYDPWDPLHRTTVDARSPASCTVFRTFQGWTALSEMHPTDGVLHLVPVPRAITYLTLKGIAGELGLLGEPGPAPRRFRADELLLPALTPIPVVHPGDSVWWHGDVVHAVAEASNDIRWGNVLYIGSSPVCARNRQYAASMSERFERGQSPLDFPDEHFEVDFVGRATVADLNELGRRQFGLESIAR